MLIMQYAREGNLHNYLRKNFVNTTWEKKIEILSQISDGYLYLLNVITVYCILSYFITMIQKIKREFFKNVKIFYSICF